MKAFLNGTLIKWLLINAPILLFGLMGSLISLFFVPNVSNKRALAGISCGVFCSIVFTEPIYSIFNLRPDMLQPTAALLGLTGYELVRRLMAQDSGLADFLIDKISGLYSSKKIRGDSHENPKDVS